MLSLSPTKWMRILVPVAAALLLLVAACGGDDDDGGNGDGNGGNGDTPADQLEPQPVSPQEIQDEVTEAVDGVLNISITDLIYTKNNLKVPVGETTTIEILNEGTALHNMRIAGPDGEWNTDDDWFSDPDFITGGSTGVVEFNPTLTGTYVFRCDVHPTTEGGQIVVG